MTRPRLDVTQDGREAHRLLGHFAHPTGRLRFMTPPGGAPVLQCEWVGPVSDGVAWIDVPTVTES